MKELPTYTPDFEEYIRQGEPDKKERAQIWRTAIGLQQVDGLEVSEYFKETVKRNIEGEISIDEVQKLIDEHYKCKDDLYREGVYIYEREYVPAPLATRERLLNYLKGRPWADNVQLSFVLKVSISTIRYHLRKLQKEGTIIRYHSEGVRGDFWEIIQ